MGAFDRGATLASRIGRVGECSADDAVMVVSFKSVLNAARVC